MKSFFLLVLFCSTFFGSESHEDHDIHVGICELDLRKDIPRMTIKTFLDDLQVAVGLEPGDDIPDGYTSSEELITDYIHRSITLSQADESLSYEILSIDASSDAVWIICEIQDAPSLSQIRITNTFLTEIYDDQVNLVKLITSSGRKTERMDGGITELALELE